jgi:4-amino-4-deoxy-L-arabinose transferase-like glycosyltransferase
MLAIGLFLALYLTAAVRAPLLTDEMYYWDWSRHLAFGYFDHPPLIAFVIRLGTAVAGTTAFGVRLGPLACGALTATLLFLSARRIGGASAGRRALLLLAAIPLLTGSFLLATPDAPFLAATAAVVYFIIRALDASATQGSTLPWWSAAGVAAGLAMESKYTAMLVAGAFGLGFLVFPPLRARLRTFGPWLTFALALAVVAPNLAWNASHDWVSLQFQLNHGLGPGGGGNPLERELSFLGGQIALVSPILLPLMAWAVYRALRSRSSLPETLLSFVAALTFGFFMFSASRKPVEANWPAGAYIPAVLLLATLPLGVRSARWLKAGAILGIGLTAVALVHLITPILPLAREVDQLADSHGWPNVAEAVGKTLAAERNAGRRVFLAGNRYQEAAALAFYLPDHPEVLSLNVDYRGNEYDLRPRFEAQATPGDEVLLVIEPWAATSVVPRLSGRFAAVNRIVGVERRRGRWVLSPRDLWLFSGWRGAELPWGVRP